MNKKKIAIAAAAGAVTSLIAPTSAHALSEKSNPSCAAAWAHNSTFIQWYLDYFGVPLGQAQKDFGSGFASYMARMKVSATSGYCCD